MRLITTFLLFIFLYAGVAAQQDGVAAYYPFNGNANDESGNGNDGTVNGAILTSDRFGRADKAYYFDGSSYISIPDNSNINISSGQSFTVSYWLKHNAQNNNEYVISKYKGSFGEPSYAFGTETSGDAYSWFEFTASNGVENRGSVDLNDNKWHNITTVFKSGESISIYVDGVPDVQESISYTGSIINTRDLTIGCGSNFAQYYTGSIDDIKIYNRALTENEIQNEVSELIAYYPFNGNADDVSGYGNNGTVYGAVLAQDKNGNEDAAYYFDGTDDYILCDTEVGPFGDNSRTFTFWAKTDVEPNGSNQQNTVLSYGGNISVGGSRFEIVVNPKCRGLGVDLSTRYVTYGFDNSDNDWHFYAVVFDGSISSTTSGLKYYADGVLLNTVCNSNGGEYTINTLDEQVLNIGRLFYTGQPRYFRGSLDELRIYGRALTRQEITDLYDSGVPVAVRKNITVKKSSLFYSNGALRSKEDRIRIKDLVVVNISGRMVYHASDINLPLNMGFLVKGLYLVRLTDEQGHSYNMKIFKN